MLPLLTFIPPIIAHRGARDSAPENTLAALRIAHEQHVSWVEVDTKLTHDGVPILMHDEMLDRTTDGKGAVADTEWSIIQKLDAGRWFEPRFIDERVPTLTAALKLILELGLKLNLEIKPCPGRARATTMVVLIEAAKIWPENQVPPLISSFDMECLQIAAQLLPHWPRGLLLDKWDDNWQDSVTKVQASTINLEADLLTEERVENLLKAQLPILTYTVNDPLRAKELLNWGVSAVFTDKPREMMARL